MRHPNWPCCPAAQRSAARRVVSIALILAVLPLLTACSTPALNAKVIRGHVSFVAVVENDDPRLEQPGLPGVTIQLHSNPESLGRKPLGSTLTDDTGRAALNVDLPAAGLARYEIELIARKQGYAHARGTFIMPGSAKTILVFLNPGVDTYREPENLLEEAERYK